MKWLVVVVSLVVCLASLSRGSALICQPGSKDAQCLSENTEKEPESTEPPNNVREREKVPRWRKAECLAGSEWDSKCHKCRCTEDGRAECTRMDTCEKGDYGEPIRCKPGTSYKDECNTCSCRDSGVSACTMVGCWTDHLLPQPESNWKECLPGSRWKSKCNECFCTEDGSPACTEMACEASEDEPVIECAPGTSWKNDCNRCWCDNGRAACTRMGCVPAFSLTDSPVRSSRKLCLPGSRWKSKCNECFCTEDGLKACTEQTCVPNEDVPVMECAPGTSWKNDCNRCWCDDGRAACTKMGCDTALLTGFFPVGAESSTENSEPDNQSPKSHHNVVKRSAICIANASFKVHCNYCKCAADGRSYSCSNHECMVRDVTDDVEVFMESEDPDHIERHSVCKPRGTFYIGCNTCHCSADGMHFSCTNKPCPLPKDVEVFHELRALRSAVTEKDVVCAANRMFIKDCNTCWCNEDGTSYFCTRKVCITDTELPDEANDEAPEKLREIKRKCRPDEVFELDCNTCHCNADGSSFSCTRKACVPEEKEKSIISSNRRIRATTQLETPKACTPGLEFRMDCNKCLCDNDGHDYSCTRIDCSAVNGNGNGGARRKREATTQVKTHCVPASVFEQGCNVCLCEADGAHATCSIKRCKLDKPDEEDTDLATDSDLSFRCNPGEQFKRGCNDCTCSADGKSVFCTLRLCDQDLSPGA